MSAPARFTVAERAAIAAIILVWGTNNIAAKVATNELPPLFVGGLRFVIALVFLIPFLRPPFGDWRRLLPIMLLAGPLHFAAVYGGFALTSTVSAYVVSLQLWIPMTALAAWWILGERMPLPAIAGVAVAVLGVAWMTLDPGGGADPLAIVVGLLASALWALATVLVRRSPTIRPLKMQALTAVVAAPALLAASAVFEQDVPQRIAAAPPIFWGAMVWAGLVSTVGATVLLFWLVQRREAGRVTPYLLLTPLVSASLGVLVLGERLSMQVILGGAATLAGVAIVSFAERQAAKVETAPT